MMFAFPTGKTQQRRCAKVFSGMCSSVADRIHTSTHGLHQFREAAHVSELLAALHFNPRFDEGDIVRNSKIGGSWGGQAEERDGGIAATHLYIKL